MLFCFVKESGFIPIMSLSWNKVQATSPSLTFLLYFFSPPSLEAEHPWFFKYVWQKGHRALHGDGRPPQHRGPHTSLQPANWGLALPPKPPNPPVTSADPHHYPTTTAPPSRPSISLQHSSPRHMALKLGWCWPRPRDWSTSAVQTFLPGGRFCWGDFLWAFMPAWYNYCRYITTGCDRWTRVGGHLLWLQGITPSLCPCDFGYSSESNKWWGPEASGTLYFPEGHFLLSVWLSEVVLPSDHTRAVLALN